MGEGAGSARDVIYTASDGDKLSEGESNVAGLFITNYAVLRLIAAFYSHSSNNYGGKVSIDICFEQNFHRNQFN